MPSEQRNARDALMAVANRMDELALTADKSMSWEDIYKLVRREVSEALGLERMKAI